MALYSITRERAKLLENRRPSLIQALVSVKSYYNLYQSYNFRISVKRRDVWTSVHLQDELPTFPIISAILVQLWPSKVYRLFFHQSHKITHICIYILLPWLIHITIFIAAYPFLVISHHTQNFYIMFNFLKQLISLPVLKCNNRVVSSQFSGLKLNKI